MNLVDHGPMKAALCNGTSVLGHPQPLLHVLSRPTHEDDRQGHPTLEQMVLQLELEEELARKSKLLSSSSSAATAASTCRDDLNYKNVEQGRMSCVMSSDVLRSARHALSQYPPRFSLDGKDAMNLSSFHRSVYVGGLRLGRGKTSMNAAGATAKACLPRSLGGQMAVVVRGGGGAEADGAGLSPGGGVAEEGHHARQRRTETRSWEETIS